ncbi:PREDICTED: bidirectional sugar transporter SWEET17-like [Ipomoea nil]|uniref:bidirectional sugar transporter SWEET17-like n=1 Tax=Ipomoea nil TaxID=35883 RepID=UPI000900BEDA|nr:PREDICTED: bidirectional sugar transporter SWEET17-like [Ipomoea nil]
MVKPEFIVGVIGNIITILLCASPALTLWKVVKKKISAEGYDAVPHMCQLVCRSLWVLYGILVPVDAGLLIITVNSVGVLSQIIYLIIYLVYAPIHKKVKSLMLVGLMNICFPGLAIALSVFVFHEKHFYKIYETGQVN